MWNHKFQPHNVLISHGTKWKRGSTKSVRFILWWPWMWVQYIQFSIWTNVVNHLTGWNCCRSSNTAVAKTWSLSGLPSMSLSLSRSLGEAQTSKTIPTQSCIIWQALNNVWQSVKVGQHSGVWLDSLNKKKPSVHKQLTNSLVFSHW